MQTGTVLIVDDDPEIRSLIAEGLQQKGFETLQAAGGDEAMENLAPGRTCLVVADVKMPGMSGIELLRRIKRTAPELPVMMVTGYGSIRNAAEAMQEGACDYLLKPFSLETLILAVERALDTHRGNGRGRTPQKRAKAAAGKKIITRDSRLLALLAAAANAASSNATVLIQGESGTGKELLASYIHCHGLHPDGPYVAVNCASLPENLAESELFGHEKGAFTGAFSRKTGKFEQANQGTLVLDEISEMPLALQAKLLRVLQEREIDRVGGQAPVPVDTRVIVISNRDLREAVAEGTFRQDLYYRVNVIPLTIPPLRQRRDDILLLAGHFLARFSACYGKSMTQISARAGAMLLASPWRGNVRELENAMERAVLMGSGERLLPEHLFLEGQGGKPVAVPETTVNLSAGVTLRDMEKKLIFETLDQVNDNRTHAARMLGISIRTLRNKLRQYREEHGLAP
jgi:two-component system response regulator FlrC